MAFPYVLAFLVILLVYMVYSEWAGLDSRWLVASALVLLVATAVVDAAGATNLANTLAEFVFFLLAGGVVLLLIDHVREGPTVVPTPASRWGSGLRPWQSDTPDPSQQGERSPDQSLDRPE
ncbi:MAG: hypothetical protein ACRECT_02255 [Thermoplasmata archaeon]